MKSLDKYIQERLIQTSKWKLPESQTWEEFCVINNLNDDTVSKEAIEFFYEYNINNFFGRNSISTKFVFETLSSHNTQALINKINKEFIDNINFISIEKYDYENSNIFDISIKFNKDSDIVIDNEINSESEDGKKLLNILVFFRYYITLISEGNECYIIDIEPSETKNVINDIQKSGNIVYHITNKENVKNILKRGLVTKTSSYRYYPERIFLIANKKDKEELQDDIIEIIRDKELFPNKYAILKIDLHHMKNINIYVDPAYSDNCKYYTYENIPPKFIKVVSLTNL